jgi:hypothetical protein
MRQALSEPTGWTASPGGIVVTGHGAYLIEARSEFGPRKCSAREVGDGEGSYNLSSQVLFARCSRSSR